jgi:hypothetical protein
MRQWALIGLVLVTVMGLTGCGSLMHPRAEEFLTQAKGSNGIETQLNLIQMVQSSIEAARGQGDFEPKLDTLHNQLYALKTAGCQVTEAQASTVAYAKASTLRREVRTIFRQLWKVKDDPSLRDAHLDMLATRLQELREALQAVKG